jgi:hypothetical protein
VAVKRCRSYFSQFDIFTNSYKIHRFQIIFVSNQIVFFTMRTLHNISTGNSPKFIRKLTLRILDIFFAVFTKHFPSPYNLNFNYEAHICRKCLNNPLSFNSYKFEYDPIVECEVCGKMTWSENNSYLK